MGTEMHMGRTRPTILLVEDDTASAEMLIELLGMADYDVEATDSADGAIAAMAKRRYGAVLLDLTLPGLTTSELVERLRQVPAKPPIVLFSARTLEDLHLAFDRLSAAAMLQKPVDMDRLLATMARAVRGEA